MTKYLRILTDVLKTVILVVVIIGILVAGVFTGGLILLLGTGAIIYMIQRDHREYLLRQKERHNPKNSNQSN